LPCLFRFFSSLFFFPTPSSGLVQEEAAGDLASLPALTNSTGQQSQVHGIPLFLFATALFLLSIFFCSQALPSSELGLPAIEVEVCSTAARTLLRFMFISNCINLFLLPLLPIFDVQSALFLPISPFSGHGRACHECCCASGFRGHSTLLLNS
jgi:hypothetical protein